MLYDRQERQILNEHPNTLAHDLLMIDIQCKRLRRECSKHTIVKIISYVLDKTVTCIDRLIKNFLTHYD